MDFQQKSSVILQDLLIPEQVSDRNMVFSLQKSNLEIQMQKVLSGCLLIKSLLILIFAVHQKEKYGSIISQLKGIMSKTSIGSRYANDFFIFTLEWTSDKLVWKINDTEVFTQTSDVPQEPMYVLLAGGTDKPINGMTSMEIDWVRVYKSK